MGDRVVKGKKCARSRLGRVDRPLKIELQRADVIGWIERDRILVGCELIRLLGPGWRAVVSLGRPKRAPDRAVVFQQGDPTDSVCLVLSGTMRIVARRDSDLVELGTVHPGELFGVGEASKPRWCSAVAAGACEFQEFDRRVLLDPTRPASRAISQVVDRLYAERRKALDELTDFMNRW